VQRDSDEDAWRAIVENYGDRVELEGETEVRPSAEPADPGLERLFRPLPQPEDPRDLDQGPGHDAGLDPDPDDGFVPPAPPPLPKVPPDRFLAWSGLFGSPSILLVCLVVGVHLAPWLGYLLVASFIGGFAYLVVKMPRGPADPWDDGARL